MGYKLAIFILGLCLIATVDVSEGSKREISCRCIASQHCEGEHLFMSEENADADCPDGKVYCCKRQQTRK